MTNMSGRKLAACLGISSRKIGRLERAGLLVRQPNGTFDQQATVQGLLKYFMEREVWAFHQLARHRIFDERTGDVCEPPHQR
jgi:hypothetical protein